ncbi:glycoside hydrolase family 19 protein [Paraburkholderia sediminicola]|uniref:glycoside hydrolase family 19 protein n=1 Tax=Paraburkholderia sediminicola TaxID=458836 RepID=UPI0038BCE4C6
MKVDDQGFLIADKGLRTEDFTTGIVGVRNDTSAILALLKMGARSYMQDRARVRSTSNGRNDAPGRADAAGSARSGVASNPNASRQPSPADPAAPPRATVERARDAQGRFTDAPKSELAQVAKVVNSLTRRQAAVVAAQQVETARQAVQKPTQQETQRASQPSERDARGRFVGGAKAGGAGNTDDADEGGESEVRRKSEREAADGILSRFKGLLASIKTPGAGVGDFDKIEPAVEASKELGHFVSGPLNAVGSVGKAVVGSRFGHAKDASVSWLQRIFSELRTARTQSDAAANAQPPDANITTDGGAQAEPALAPTSDGPTPVSTALATGSSTPPPVSLPTAAIGLPGIHAPSRVAAARSKGAGRVVKSVASPVASTTPSVSPSPLPNTSVGRAVIGRGFGGGKDGSPSWLRRIVRELRLSRAQAGEFALAEARVLHDIERKTGGGFSPERAGVLGGIAGGVGGLLGKGGGLLGALLSGGMKLSKGALKRLPILGALFAGGSALASAFGGDDPNKSAEQNRHGRYTGVGSGVGAIVGGALGSLLGPVGTLVGSVIGDRVGELVGDWLSTVDWSAVGKTITTTWDTAVGTVKDTWKTVTDGLGEVVKTVSDVWSGILSSAKAFLKDKFGIDVDAMMEKAKTAIAPVVNSAKAFAAPIVATAKEVGGKVADGAKATAEYGKERVEKMATPYKTAAAKVVDFGKGLVGGSSKANRSAVMSQAATIAAPNERAAFLAQVDHESGGFRNTEENLNYSAKGLRKTFGKYFKTDAEAAAAAKAGPNAIANKVYGGRMGNTDPGDGYKYRGRGAIQLTGRDNYTAASKALGIDLVNNPDLLKDPNVSAKAALWYWNSRAGLAEAARKGDDVAVRKKVNGGTIGLDDTRAKTASYLASIKAGDPAVSAVTASAAAPSLPFPVVTVAANAVPPVPPMPPASVPPPAPPPTVAANIPHKLNSDGPLQVRVAKDTTVGQDLTDQRLAQIATGGIAPG